MKRTLIGGFTLLEVMVAVAILALSLTAIFSSQGGAIRAGTRARQLTTATLLARCKMAEVEEEMAREGFPAVMAQGDDACCEDGEHEGFSCHWQVEQVMLPDAITDNDPLGLSGGGEGGGGPGGNPGGAGGGEGATTSNLEQALTGAAGGDMIGSFAVQYTYPILRPMIEQQVRRATVSVRWREGARENSARGPCAERERGCFSVVQYLVADQGMAAPGTQDALSGGSGSGGSGGTGSGGLGGGSGVPAGGGQTR
jgi:general secretion pathway protein I